MARNPVSRSAASPAESRRYAATTRSTRRSPRTSECCRSSWSLRPMSRWSAKAARKGGGSPIRSCPRWTSCIWPTSSSTTESSSSATGCSRTGMPMTASFRSSTASWTPMPGRSANPGKPSCPTSSRWFPLFTDPFREAGRASPSSTGPIWTGAVSETSLPNAVTGMRLCVTPLPECRGMISYSRWMTIR